MSSSKVVLEFKNVERPQYHFVDANGKDCTAEVYAQAARIPALAELGRNKGMSSKGEQEFYAEIGQKFCGYLQDHEIGALVEAYKARQAADCAAGDELVLDSQQEQALDDLMAEMVVSAAEQS